MILLTALLMTFVAACGGSDDDVTLEEPTEDATESGDEDSEDESDEAEETDATEEPEEVEETEETEEAEDPEATDDPEASDGSEDAPRPGSDVELTGTFGGDPLLEGGCVWLDADDGNRYEVMWPEDMEADTNNIELMENGELVAEAGDQLTVQGQVTDEFASICQVGIMFQAESVSIE